MRRMSKGYSAARRVGDQALIFVSHLLVDLSCGFRGYGLGQASFDLLTKE